jgi:hypothetical protein
MLVDVLFMLDEAILHLLLQIIPTRTNYGRLSITSCTK